jgi:hypothetical protein
MDVINKLLFAFVTLIVGVVLLGTISTSVLSVNSGTNVVNETQAIDAAISGGTVNTNYPFNVTYAPTGWKADATDGCPLTGIAIKNATNTALVRDTDYTFYPTNGSWTLKGTTVNTSKFWANNNSYVSYTYCGDDYMNLGWGRSVLSVGVGMFAIALLIVSVGLFFSIARDYGLV